ncbi:MAG: sulfur oxidation c-type cytochrome SoxA [Betaproteobacteria bacterium]|nr:sulfur oxidation c-type cytochrome SoxA [Betaproteobacteria bacterium]MBI3053058.1 sulfur oxidation c-type cytochrome SoxA [Betaproteobacteria bacterium]
MSGIRSSIAAITLACVSAMAFAQGSASDPLAVGRQMLAEDNPGELWIDKGKQLFYEKRGPKSASLEQCDFGLGPGKLEGATTRLPRYFPDTDKVQDLESRLLTCMVRLQGFKREDIVKRAISPGGSNGSDVEALALYITSRSNGMKMNVALSHQKEYDMYKAGEYLFYRRSGQTDFACIQCHGESGKRIRLQDLVNMTDKKQIQETVSTFPAYRGAHFVVRTMQWRLYDCFWQMRLPELAYASDTSIALTTYLHYQGNGAAIQVPGFKR